MSFAFCFHWVLGCLGCYSQPAPTLNSELSATGPNFGVHLTVYQVNNDQLTLISADGKKRVRLGKWSDRVRDPRNTERHGVIIRVGAQFPSFTLLDAEGYFRSNVEDTLVIQIATDNPERVLQVAHDLRCFLNQEGVGVLCRGIYQRVRYWTDDRMILQAWGFPASE